jgi:hypothetical protein
MSSVIQDVAPFISSLCHSVLFLYSSFFVWYVDS